MTIDKAGSADDVDIVIAIDNDDDTTANNNNNEMTNDITIETEADTAATAADDNTAEMITNDIKIELDEEAPPLPQSPIIVEQAQQQSPPLPDLQIEFDEDGRPWVIEQQKLPWWKRCIEAALWIYHPLIFFIINVSLIVPLALTEQLVFVYCLACLWAPVFILIACRRNIQDYMARREEN